MIISSLVLINYKLCNKTAAFWLREAVFIYSVMEITKIVSVWKLRQNAVFFIHARKIIFLIILFQFISIDLGKRNFRLLQKQGLKIQLDGNGIQRNENYWKTRFIINFLYGFLVLLKVVFQKSWKNKSKYYPLSFIKGIFCGILK